MKYAKSIIALMFINILLVFSMIFVANKTRDLEKKNNILLKEIVHSNEIIKINKIELISHQKNSYLKKLYSLYFTNTDMNNKLNIISIKKFSNQDKKIQLVKSENYINGK